MEICEEFFAANRKLYHYTSISSALSILNSNSLWASHYSCTNDKSEQSHIHHVLRLESTNAVKKFIENNKYDASIKQCIDQFGDNSALIKRLSDDIYDILCGNHLSGRGVLRKLFDNFVISFCTHDKLSAYTQKNGLLSQWIHYGGATGCAIVFDTRAISKALQEQENKFSLMVDISEMIYMTDSYRNHAALRAFRGDLGEIYDSFLRDKKDDIFPGSTKILNHLLELSSRLKHEAFENEHEIRITAVPILDDGPRNGRMLKEIKYRENRGIVIPYIDLFGDGERLPISEIIIGLSREQDKIITSLSRMCEPLDIRILKSETPLIF